MKVENWNIEELTGYVPKTTFYSDFSIADQYGVNAIKDTYERDFNEWKGDTEFVTELAMVLNWKCLRWYEHNDEYSKLYTELYEKTNEWCLDNLKCSDLTYYIQTTD